MCDLWEAEEEDDVDDGEGEHVARDHREDHCHKGSRQLHGSAGEVNWSFVLEGGNSMDNMEYGISKVVLWTLSPK